ncbi:MAG: hypothetical protein AB2A00_11735 [Myxococcota bacterium]
MHRPAGDGSLDAVGYTGYTQDVKTAISLPDDLFARLEAFARRAKLTRSGVLAMAAREFLDAHGDDMDATAAWNAALARGGPPGEDKIAAAFRRRSRQVLRQGSDGWE